MSKVLAGILLLGPLIIVHELGHLIAAKLVDIKVLRFSIGFGPPLFKIRLGETEYCLAPIPLGGYVHVLGHHPGDDIPVSEADRALTSKPLWAKYLFYLAGPLANLVLPIAVMFVYYLTMVSVVPPPVVGTVLPGSAAHDAGLQQGDRIVAIDERDVRSWTELVKRVGDSPEQELEVQIERDGQRLDRVITPKKIVRRDDLGVPQERGLLGVINSFFAPEIGILDRDSPAWTEGLRTGDVVTSINGEPVRTIEELERMLDATGDALVRLTYLRPTPVDGPGGTYLWYQSHHAQLLPRKGGDSPTGILSARTFIRSVEPGSPAAEAGMRAGDRVVAVDGEPYQQWSQLDDVFSRKRDEPIVFELQSPGESPRKIELTLGTRKWKDIYDYEHEDLWFGAEPFAKSSRVPLEPLRGRLTYSMRAALDDTFGNARRIWGGLLQMFTGRIAMENLSSVVGIVTVAATAYEQGPGVFLHMLAFISINLFFVNLLPIPVLDGGHLAFFTIEAIRRKPVSQRAREIAAAIGLVIIIILLLIATRNDIVRHFL